MRDTLPPHGRRRQRDDRHAALRARGAANEIELPAESAVGPRAQRIGAHLPGQIHLQRGVDGDHAIVLRDDEWIVGVARSTGTRSCGFSWMKSNSLCVPSTKAAHRLAAMQRFALAVDYARFHQIDDAVRTHFGVNTEVVLVAEAMQHRFGDAADAGLQRCAIGNERGHVARDAQVHLGEGLGAEFEQRPRCLNECRDLADVNGGVAMRARHPLVDFGDDGLGAARRRQRAVDRGAQAHESVRVGRRHLHQHDIERHRAAFKQAFDFAEEDWRVVGAAGGDRLAHVFAEKQSAMAKVAFVLRFRVVGAAPSVFMWTISTSCTLGSSRNQRIYKH